MNESLCQQVHQVTLRWLKVKAQQFIPKHVLDNCLLSVEEIAEDWCEGLLLTLEKKVLAREVQEVERVVQYPATWWQHFKEQFFPSWLKKRFPVRMRRVVVRLERWEGYPASRWIPPELGDPSYYVFAYEEDQGEAVI